MSARIPTLDITRFDTDREAFVAELGAAYREWGFAGIRNHGIPQARIDAAYDVFKRFFALPEDVKKQYHVPGGGGARGYTPFGVETAKDSKHFDLKEFWHIGREIPEDSEYRDVMPPNLWPAEVPGFREHGYGLYQALDQLGSRVLSALALHIGLPEDYFADKTDSGNSILRPIHYPPITADDIPNVRAGAHEDINLITLLVGASAAGLEVRSKQGEWVPFTSDADTIVDSNWLSQMAGAGADMVLGTVRIPVWRLPVEVARRYLPAYQSNGPGHDHVHGANMGFRADAYWSVGGFRALATGEDVDLVERFEAAHLSIHRDAKLSVTTSARQDGRAPGGFAAHLRQLARSSRSRKVAEA